MLHVDTRYAPTQDQRAHRVSKECNAINEHWPNIYVCENGCNNSIYRPNLEIRGKNLFIELGCPFSFDDTKISLEKLETVIKYLKIMLKKS